MKQFRFHDVAARRAQAIAEEEEESIVPPPSTPKSQQSRMLFALSTPTRQTPQRVKTEDKVEKMLRNQMSGAVNPGEITSTETTEPDKKTKPKVASITAQLDDITDEATEIQKATSLEEALINQWSNLSSVNETSQQSLDREAEWLKIYNNHRRIISRFTPPVPEQSDNPSLSRPFNQNQGPTHLHTFLRTVSSEDLANPQAHTLPYSLETQENHRWVYRLLKDFADAMELESVLPLECNVVKQFIYVLGINDLVSVASLDSTVRCALGVLDSLHRGGPTPQAIHSAISDSVNLVKKTKLTPDVSIGKPPLIASDLHTIIVHIPDCIPEKTFEASLFLFSLSTGVRASTCAAIELKDIERIVCLKDSSVLLITIRLRKMKGYHVQDSVVTVEGDIFAYSNLNVVYWLQQHLVQRFGLSLTSRDEWEQHWNLGERIWPIGPDAMTVRLQNRAFQAGFNRQYFGFHSLRSGFLSSALIKAGNDDSTRTRVLEQTAIVARWVPYSSVQMRYVKSATIGVHVANRLVMPNSELHATNVMEPVLTTTEIFHNTKLKPIPWTGGEQLSAFKEQVTTVLGMSCAMLTRGSAKFHALRAKATRLFCKDESLSTANCERHIQDPNQANQEERVVVQSPPPKPIRQRKYWLEWELRALADGRAANMSWEEISRLIADRGGERTPENCKIRWFAEKRDMKKKLRQNDEPPQAQYQVFSMKGRRKSGLVEHIQDVKEALAMQEDESET
ncbi:hypothetical protein BLNAU_13870 [Blattamonas nauphoetae]|uniref:Myb-like domain-containing protein n=1 Tax=Blattamonas nauphoetae TaxID=2049346 RepID=A0ABQ9XIH3_9EUKA|nr:hypothetical protein BLNAU_13870 [Blattamonas nauphoetae]